MWTLALTNPFARAPSIPPSTLRNDKRRPPSALVENLLVSVADVFIALISLKQGKPLTQNRKLVRRPRYASFASPRLCHHNHTRLQYSELFISYRAMRNMARLGRHGLLEKCPAATGHLIDSIGIGVKNIFIRRPGFWEGRYRKARPLRAVMFALLAMYDRLDWTSSNKSYVFRGIRASQDPNSSSHSLRELCTLNLWREIKAKRHVEV